MDKKIPLLKELYPSFIICIKKENKKLKKYIEKRMILEENIRIVKKEINKINKRFNIYLKKYPDTLENIEKMDSTSFLKENSIIELKEKYNLTDEDLNKKSTLKRIKRDFYIFEYSNSDKLIIKYFSDKYKYMLKHTNIIYVDNELNLDIKEYKNNNYDELYVKAILIDIITKYYNNKIIKEERYSDKINEEWICKNLTKEENTDNIRNNKFVTYSYIPKSKDK